MYCKCFVVSSLCWCNGEAFFVNTCFETTMNLDDTHINTCIHMCNHSYIFIHSIYVYIQTWATFYQAVLMLEDYTIFSGTGFRENMGSTITSKQ